MKSRQTKRAIILCLCIIFFLGATGCAKEEGCYFVDVSIVGEYESFAGREITVSGTTSQFDDPPLYFSFRTDDEEAFLHKPLHIVVTEGDTVLFETTLQRSACREQREHPYSDNPLNQEFNILYLEADGTISPKRPHGFFPSYGGNDCSDLPTPPCFEVDYPIL